MIKNNLVRLIVIFFSILLYSCGSLGDALQGKKRSDQSDEFLVEKKNPLAMPPDFEKMPSPGNQDDSTEALKGNNEVKDLLNIEDSNKKVEEKNDESDGIESSILKKIK